VRAKLTIDSEKVAKPYSLVHVPDAPVAEMIFNTGPDGILSHALANLRLLRVSTAALAQDQDQQSGGAAAQGGPA
jgi:hypothetical protein